MNYSKLDLISGLAIQFSYFPLALVYDSPWVLPFTVIIGMNIALGNFRHVYNKAREKSSVGKNTMENKEK